jgi:hypothetical protein
MGAISLISDFEENWNKLCSLVELASRLQWVEEDERMYRSVLLGNRESIELHTSDSFN